MSDVYRGKMGDVLVEIRTQNPEDVEQLLGMGFYRAAEERPEKPARSRRIYISGGDNIVEAAAEVTRVLKKFRV